MHTRSLSSILACVALAIFQTACGGSKENEKEKPETGRPAEGAGRLEAVVSTTAPEGALGVVDARAAAKPGDPIVLRGKVGGKMEPISDSYAILVLADEKAIASCDENPADECETPWDYCCEDASKIATSTATIQVTGADGRPLKSTLRGLGDLKELSRLVVSGTVAETSTPAALIVNAATIHVEKP